MSGQWTRGRCHKNRDTGRNSDRKPNIQPYNWYYSVGFMESCGVWRVLSILNDLVSMSKKSEYSGRGIGRSTAVQRTLICSVQLSCPPRRQLSDSLFVSQHPLLNPNFNQPLKTETSIKYKKTIPTRNFKFGTRLPQKEKQKSKKEGKLTWIEFECRPNCIGSGLQCFSGKRWCCFYGCTFPDCTRRASQLISIQWPCQHVLPSFYS